MSLARRVADEVRALGVRRPAVAVSGGLDSTTLLRLLVEAGIDCVAVHVDHGLRPESGADGAFVAALAADLGVPCQVTGAPPAPGNVQGQARAARYAALEAAAREMGCDAVTTAHTADDQAETMLMALIRGAGLRGLAGMPAARPISRGSDIRLVRPLLQTAKSDVLAAARAAGWAWRQDASNAGDAYRRNRIRHRVLPLLREEGGPDTVRRLAQTAAEVDGVLGGVHPAQRLARIGYRVGTDGFIYLRDLDDLPLWVQHAIWATAIAEWTGRPRSAAHVREVADLAGRRVGQRVPLHGYTAWRERESIRIQKDYPDLVPVSTASPPPWRLGVGSVLLTATPVEAGKARASLGSRSPLNAEYLDAAVLAGGAVLRPWRAGDRMRPLGLGGSRLVSDILTDRKVPPSARDEALVLEAGGEIVWLVGHRLAQSAAVTDATRETVRLVWTPRQITAPAPAPGP